MTRRPRNGPSLVNNLLLLGLILALGAAPGGNDAQAGGLDGAWCSPDGQRLALQGDRVITPSGREVAGSYLKDAFRFRMPQGEWAAGAEIWLEPKGPDAARVSRLRDTQSGPPPHDLWRRCDAISFMKTPAYSSTS